MHQTSTRSSRRAAGRRCIAAGLTATALILTACTSDSTPQADDVTNPTSDELAETLSTLGGQTVDNVDIIFDQTTATITVGGLPIQNDTFSDYIELPTNITIPTTWPTLAIQQIINEEPEGQPGLTFGVLAQTELATNDETRAALISDFWGSARFQDTETVHESVTTSADTGITCWTEIRLGNVGNVADDDNWYYTNIMFAGPGIASSGVGITNFRQNQEILDFVGSIVESACGSRPDGL